MRRTPSSPGLDDRLGESASTAEERLKNRRLSRMATINDAERPQAVVCTRHDDDITHLSTIDRFTTKLKLWVRRTLGNQEDTDNNGSQDDDSSSSDSGRVEYRLEAARRLEGRWWWPCGSTGSGYNVGMVVSQNQLSLAMYLHWMFRVNFCFLFLLSCLVFVGLTCFFAGLILAAAKMNPQCVRVGGEDFSSVGAAFADAFSLSWNTFSTVGYGSTYPALGHENTDRSDCLFITAICSFESFIGVLYSGFCGAILFGKVLRIQSHAQVRFSDPVVIRYGDGVDSYLEEDEDEFTDHGKKKIPCPVLEFRIVNRLFNDMGGEIIDATLNVVASIDSNDSDPPSYDRVETSSSMYGSSDNIFFGSLRSEDSSSLRVQDIRNRFITSMMNKVSSSRTVPHNESVRSIEEEIPDPKRANPYAHAVKKRVFSKMLLEASDHPFFKRVWLARHILDETSPLLTHKARRAIRKCGGWWPENLNNYQGVQQSLAFNQILVSLNGVSNLSASDVYAQKIYDHEDVNIGYQFVNLLYRDGNQLKIDMDLINDVKEQNGGGGEPLTFENGDIV